MNKWQEWPIIKAITDVTSQASKVDQSHFQASGKYAIVDQGQEFIAGYTDDESLVWESDLPVIIFGDHTRIIKFVDFPFVAGADGVKVLKPKSEIWPQFLYYALLSFEIPSAGYSRHFKYLKEQVVRFPSALEEQQRIAEVLARADRLRRLRHVARELSAGYLQAVFLQMFGDPVENPMGWDFQKLHHLASSVDYGVTASASSDPIGPKFLRITDIQDGIVHWDSVPYCSASEKEKRGSMLQKGDIVFARTGATTGKSYLIQDCPQGAVFASYLIRVRPNQKIDPVYLSNYFQTDAYWGQIQESSTGTAQAGVNATKLKQLRILTPPLPLQQRFAGVVRRFERLRAQQVEAERQAEALFQSLLARAFASTHQRQGAESQRRKE